MGKTKIYKHHIWYGIKETVDGGNASAAEKMKKIEKSFHLGFRVSSSEIHMHFHLTLKINDFFVVLVEQCCGSACDKCLK